MIDLVTCRSEFEYAERPEAFFWCEEWFYVKEVLSSWRSPEGKCFHVITQNGEFFELHYDETSDTWRIIGSG